MTNTIQTLTQWAKDADPTKPQPVIDALADSTFFRNPRLVPDPYMPGRQLIAFEATTPDGIKTRYMLPVHAAMTEVMLHLRATMRFTKGAPNSKVFQLMVNFGAGPGSGTPLPRLLFNAPDSGTLHERHEDEDSYPYIVPANYHVAPGLNRAKAVAIARQRDPVKADLLDALFSLADLWHSAELTN